MARQALERVGDVASEWRRSSYSSSHGDNCVEVGSAATFVGVRDTKDRASGSLAVSRPAWAAFTSAVAAGRLASRE